MNQTKPLLTKSICGKINNTWEAIGDEAFSKLLIYGYRSNIKSELAVQNTILTQIEIYDISLKIIDKIGEEEFSSILKKAKKNAHKIIITKTTIDYILTIICAQFLIDKDVIFNPNYKDWETKKYCRGIFSLCLRDIYHQDFSKIAEICNCNKMTIFRGINLVKSLNPKHPSDINLLDKYHKIKNDIINYKNQQ